MKCYFKLFLLYLIFKIIILILIHYWISFKIMFSFVAFEYILKKKKTLKFKFPKQFHVKHNKYFKKSSLLITSWSGLMIMILVCLLEVLGSKLDKCVHQCILYKCNVWTCTSWWMMSKFVFNKIRKKIHDM
jgi:hypothetical protein